MCAAAALNWTISGEVLGHYKWYQILISNQKCASKDAGSPRRVDHGVIHRLEIRRLRSIYVRIKINIIGAFS